MTREEREKQLEIVFDSIRNMNVVKNTDYGQPDDVLDTFKKIASNLETLPEKVLMVLLSKHMMTIQSAVMDERRLNETLKDRVLDAINYLTLLLAMQEEKVVIEQTNEPMIVQGDDYDPFA